MFDWLFRDRRTGAIVVLQGPNVALIVFIVTRLADLVWPHAVFGAVATVALVVWAVDEVLRGVNPWRRVLGAVVLLGQLAAIMKR
jgi:hypothetical protein